jgi:hypothetical protein
VTRRAKPLGRAKPVPKKGFFQGAGWKTLLPVVLLLLGFLYGGRKVVSGPDAGAPRPAAVRYDGRLALRLLPEVPTVVDDLQVLVSGSAVARFRWEKKGEPLAGEQGARLARHWYSRGDRISVVASANGEEGRASLTVENSLPLISAVSVSPENFCAGVDVTATPAASDADGDPIQYRFSWLVNGKEQPEDSPVLKGDRFKSGDTVSLKITPRDSYGAGRPFATRAFVVPAPGIHFVSTPPTAFSGTTYSYQARAEGAGSVSYALLSAPPGMTIDPETGRVSWPVPAQPGTYSIAIEAKDGEGHSVRQEYTLAITIS